MLVRYTRQLVTAALIAAAGLGMGACSAQPGAAVTSSAGSYSIEEVNQAVAQIGEFTGGQTNLDAAAVRAHLINEPLLENTGAAVGLTVSDEQVDQAVAEVAQEVGAQSPALGRGTRAAVKSMLLRQELNRFASSEPSGCGARSTPPSPRPARRRMRASTRVSRSPPWAGPRKRPCPCSVTRSPARRNPTSPR